MPHSIKNSELLTFKDAAVLIGISYKVMREAVRKKQVPVTVMGKSRYISRKALERWLATGEIEQTSADPSPATTQPAAAIVEHQQPPPQAPGRPWSYADEIGLPPLPRITGGA
jgi:excisionase family DNA binding protein